MQVQRPRVGEETALSTARSVFLQKIEPATVRQLAILNA